MDAARLIDHLQLEPHIEGGFFRRSYTSSATSQAEISSLPGTAASRPAMSSIYYLLSNHSPTGFLHRNRSEIMHYWQGGGAIRYTLLLQDGSLRCAVLGPDLLAGQQLQLLAPANCWKASELIASHYDYGLISEAVCPGFDYQDHQLATPIDIQSQFSQHWPTLAHLVKALPHNENLP